MVNQGSFGCLVVFGNICATSGGAGRPKRQEGKVGKAPLWVVVLLVDERIRTVALPAPMWSRELGDSAHRDGFFGLSD